MNKHVMGYLVFLGFYALTKVVVAPVINPVVGSVLKKADGTPMITL